MSERELSGSGRIYGLMTYYPTLYKPYCDAHFADLVRRGHDLVILAMGTLGKSVSHKASEYELVERTRYFLSDELREVVRQVPRLASELVHGKKSAVRAASSAASASTGLKRTVKAAARALTLPREDPDVCIVHSHETLHLVPWLKRVYSGCPVALYYYGGLPREAGGGRRQDLESILDGVDVIFTCSDYSRDEVIELGASPDKVRVLPLGFDLEDFRIDQSRTYREGNTLRLVSVGRLSHGKGYDYVLRAIRQVLDGTPDFDLHYTLVGNGVLREELETSVEEKGLQDYVTFAGAMDNRKVRQIYRRSDALVLSSFSTPNWTETQGTVIQEAMLMEALTITTRTGGVPDSIPSWMKPFHVPERDAGAIANAIRRIGSMERSRLGELGRKNREWVKEHFDIRDFNRRLLGAVHQTPQDT